MATSICLQSVNYWLEAKNSIKEAKNQSIVNRLAIALRAVHIAPTLRDRVLALEELVLACNQEIKKLDNHLNDHAHLLANISQLQAQAAFFLKSILDVKSNKELIIKLAKNREVVDASKNNILVQNFSKSAPKETLRSLNEKLEGEEKREFGVIYLNKSIREKCRVILTDGKFMQIVSTKNTSRDNRSLYLMPFNTSPLQSLFEWGATIVVDKNGNMFAGKTVPGRFHHSSFVAGKDVYFAGIIKTNAEGELLEISNESGHYRPTQANMNNFLQHLNERGALTTTLKINLLSDTERSIWHVLTFNIFNKNSSKINVDKIQHDVRKKHHSHSALASFSQWKNASNAGLFARRYTILKKIDEYLLQYFKLYNIQSPKENIALLNTIAHCIAVQRKTHTHSKRAMAIDNLDSQLQLELNYWHEKNRHLQQQEVNYNKLKVK